MSSTACLEPAWEIRPGWNVPFKTGMSPPMYRGVRCETFLAQLPKMPATNITRRRTKLTSIISTCLALPAAWMHRTARASLLFILVTPTLLVLSLWVLFPLYTKVHWQFKLFSWLKPKVFIGSFSYCNCFPSTNQLIPRCVVETKSEYKRYDFDFSEKRRHNKEFTHMTSPTQAPPTLRFNLKIFNWLKVVISAILPDYLWMFMWVKYRYVFCIPVFARSKSKERQTVLHGQFQLTTTISIVSSLIGIELGMCTIHYEIKSRVTSRKWIK